MRLIWITLILLTVGACDFLGDPYPDRETIDQVGAPTTSTLPPQPTTTTTTTTTTTMPPSVSVGRPWGTVNGV
ncbi:MAG: hypothetical protein OEY55_05410, partial [Acidimicrobiia bacterium]|nr:hypothetical protein [Acidimicrobiia bacterium]